MFLALPDPLVRVRIRGSGFYPDPYQNVTDPQYCLLESMKAVIAYEPSIHRGNYLYSLTFKSYTRNLYISAVKLPSAEAHTKPDTGNLVL